MTAFAGIDFDTFGVHVVLLQEDRPRADYHHFPLEDGADAFERTRSVRDAMPARGWWNDHGVVAAGIEEPAGRSVGFAFRVQGGILACLPRRLLVEKFMPSQWRKAVGLPGNCTKDRVRLFVHDDLRARARWRQDACDAFCLALAVEKVTVFS